MAKHGVVLNSTSGSDEEEEEEDEEEVEESIDGQSGTLFESTLTAANFSRFAEMSRQFAEMMEMHRKQPQLMAKKKSAWASLSFDSPPPAKSANWRVPSCRKDLQQILSARHRQMRISNVTPLPRSRLAPLHVFHFRRNLSKLLQYSRMNAPLRKSTSASAT